jgi:ligand-binding sensor domain-containing protein/two-component sensor histidine kinase
VWVGTPQGISVLDTRTNEFKHYQFENYKKAGSLARKIDQAVSVLYKDRFGKIWIGTQRMGVCSYDEAKDDFRFYILSKGQNPQLTPTLGWPNSILHITESKTNDSIIWAGTPGGLQKINKYTGEVRLYTFEKPQKDYQVALNAFRRLYHHDDGLLYVGSWAAGVNVFDPIKETFTPLILKNEEGKKIVYGPIRNIHRKSEHEIWISTGAGLAVYDTRIHEVTWSKFSSEEKNETYGIDLIDDANRFWIGTGIGAQYFDPAMQQFARYSFKHLTNIEIGYAFYIFSDSSGNYITVCPRQTDGIYHFDKLKKTWTKKTFPHNESFKREIEAIRSFVKLPSGDYLISGDRGIYIYSENSNKMTLLDKNRQFSKNRRGQIVLGDSGYVWFYINENGFVKWKPGAKEYKIYKVPVVAGDTSKTVAWINHIYRDSKKNFWFQTPDGIGVYEASKDSIINFNYSINPANSLPVALSFAEDKAGRVWVNSNDGWLGYGLSNEPLKGIVYKINIKQRGLGTSISELTTDNQGQVWGYTLNEMVKINPDNFSFTTYSFQYGIGEADFYHFSFLPSGEIIFGGRNDIIIANTTELKRNREIPVPYVDRLEVLNQPYELGMGQPVQLNYKQNFFSFGFSAIAFTMSKDVKFRYRLKGFDDWSEPTRRRFANYTNVPGGDYVFELQAANNEGLWNPKILELPVHVDTAFWRTWWFRAGAILFFVLAMYLLYRSRVESVRKKQQLKWDYEKKLANVEMTALLSQMNPHFIFNSLNSIDSYIIRNESKQASEYLNNFARLMRLILQNSRSNYISLKDELIALELYLQMESMRFKNKFRYTINVDETLDKESIVMPPMLIQPYVENAIWHGLMTKSNGEEAKVELGIHKQDDNLLCIISDNGIGRKRAAELKEKKVINHKRSMGMQITQDRMEIINKLYNLNTSVRIFDMENEKGEATGTRVELTIPI